MTKMSARGENRQSRKPSPSKSTAKNQAAAPSVADEGLQGGLEDVLQSLVVQAVALLKGDGGGFYISNQGQRTLRCVVATGTPATVLGTVLRYGEGAAGTVAETGAPVRVDDYRTWPRRSPQFEESAPFRAVVSVPTRLRGEVTGVLHVLRTGLGQPFTAEDVELLNIFANQAGVALENARLLEETNRRVRQLSILNDLTRAALLPAILVDVPSAGGTDGRVGERRRLPPRLVG
jgi:GAF domain-containing protein